MLPSCDAVTVQSPADTKVRALPLTLHTEGVPDANCTGRPELAEADSTVGLPLMDWSPGAAKLMVCAVGAGATVTVRVTGLAAMKLLLPS